MNFSCTTLKHTLCRHIPGRVRRYAAYAGVKRFYEDVTISPYRDGFEVNLGTRKLKSPSGTVLRIPSETLAQAVALEWDSQKEALKYHTMPVTNLCFYATDKPNGEKSVLVESCLRFLDTDTILFHSDEPPGLADQQLQEWGPVITWAQDRYKVKIPHTMGFAPPIIPRETVQAFRQHLLFNNHWALTGYERLVNTLKSLLLSIALVERRLTVEEAVSLSRLEQEYQISKWGNVEWYHDVDLLEHRSRAAACTFFIHAYSEGSRTIKLH